MSHLGERVSALVDGELGHAARERALAHVAHCTECRDRLEAERETQRALRAAADPTPSPQLLSDLLGLAAPGGPLPPRARRMPLAPVVPTLPAPGRFPRGGSSGPGRHVTRARRARYATAGAVSVALVTLGTAFAVGGAAPAAEPPVLPPSAGLSVEHAATTSGLPLRDPAFDAVTATYGGLVGPPTAPR